MPRCFINASKSLSSCSSSCPLSMHRVAIIVSMVLRTRGLDRDLRSAQLDDGQSQQHFSCKIEGFVIGEAPQHLRQDQIADSQRLAAEQRIQFFGPRRYRALEVIDPDARIDQYQWPVLIASRSPCQFSFPRRARIFACFLSRIRVRNPNSTASRFVGAPVARRASRIMITAMTVSMAPPEFPRVTAVR